MSSVRKPNTIHGVWIVLAAVLLSSCTDDAADEPEESPGKLEVNDAWVVTADEGMTAVFGVLDNASGEKVVIESAESELSDMELHEMAMSDGDTVMREKEDGFTVAAGDSHTLEPGGDHLMLMDLSAPILAGEEIDITLRLATGDPVTFTAVAKDFAGADEEYDGEQE